MRQKTSQDVIVLSVNGEVSESIKRMILKKEIENHPNLDPKGYYWSCNHLHHNGVSVLKKARKTKISKSESKFSGIDFLQLVVSKKTADYQEKYIETSGKDIEWKPLIISNPENESDLELFKQNFLISEDGMVAQVNPDDICSYIVKTPYWHRYGFSISLSIPGVDKVIAYRNQTIKNLVKNSWGEDASAFIAEQEEFIKSHEEEYLKKAV